MDDPKLINFNDIPCCPDITVDPCCNRLQFTYRLDYNLADAPVEFVVTAVLERCPGPLSLGDVVYSTTLLPGEKVRLYQASRNTRFSYDAESEVSYRHEQASEETYYMSSMDRFMSDLTINEDGGGSAQSSSEFETEGSVSNWTDAIFGRPDAKVEGSFSGESSFDFMRDIKRHAEASHERSVEGTRAANSVSMGEVSSRTHAEGETESAYEAATRILENRNECHSVTYLAYQLMKRQTMKFSIKSIVRRVRDPAGDAGVATRALRPGSRVAVIPNGILSTDANRIEVEAAGRTAAVSKQANLVSNIASPAGRGGGLALSTGSLIAAPTRGGLVTNLRARPLNEEVRQKALQQADEELVKAGVIDKVGGNLRAEIAAELSFEVTSCLPTQAIIVKGCLDDCNTCEEPRREAMKLANERKALENKMLERQIALLDKHHDYRCCPAGEIEDAEPVPEDA
ncbi:hypothetical protein AIOL_001415 [Candidatus Rhodobacter oscarellae]|uniref:Uncharacterized protein n=1 Tax=Candidatus Rhodobacter oscarellae TaxID=1675527 RepID=A0A0J9E0J0_9RHOB|nr:hypothetical protein [Candidatus Rhodobacter lobularis]KMW56461.1 hypothetical protein AIOL_001415 [Candidatus Rhodobacter lobularis]